MTSDEKPFFTAGDFADLVESGDCREWIFAQRANAKVAPLLERVHITETMLEVAKVATTPFELALIKENERLRKALKRIIDTNAHEQDGFELQQIAEEALLTASSRNPDSAS